MTPLLVRFLACVLAVAACSFTGVHGRTIWLNWTVEGVRNYTSTPLKTELGDQLVLTCGENISNLVILADQTQYDSCNASAGSGVFQYSGLCVPGAGNSITLTLTINSQQLANTINFMNNRAYFFTSIGYPSGSDDEDFTSGGQCEDGLKMIIIIGEIEEPTSTSDEIIVTDSLTTTRLTTNDVMVTESSTSVPCASGLSINSISPCIIIGAFTAQSGSNSKCYNYGIEISVASSPSQLILSRLVDDAEKWHTAFDSGFSHEDDDSMKWLNLELRILLELQM